MEFKKCVRCGCFFMSEDNVCCNCHSKDQADLATLNSFINQDDITISSLNDISINTGININNLNRLIKNNDISNLNISL